MERVLNWIGSGIVLLTALIVPIIFDTNHLSVIATPKTLFIIGGAIVLAAIALVALSLRKSVSFSLTPRHGALLLFMGILTLSAAVGVDPWNSLFGSFERSIGLTLFYGTAAIALLIPFFLNTPRKVRAGIVAFFVGAFLLAATVYLDSFPALTVSVFQYSLEGGAMGNTSLAAAYLLFGIFMGGYLFLTAKKFLMKGVFALGVLAMLFSPVLINVLQIVNYFTKGDVPLEMIVKAQGAFLGLCFGAAATTGLFLTLARKKQVRIAGYVLLAVLLVSFIGATFSFLDPEGYLHEKYIELKTPNRFVFWDIALQGLQERPLLGWGFENYQYVYEQHFDPRILETGYLHELWVADPHNVVLGYASTSGALGLLAYLILFGLGTYSFVVLRRRKEWHLRVASAVFPGLLAAIFVQNLFVFDSPPSIFGFFFLVGIAFIFETKRVFTYTFVPRALFGKITVAHAGAVVGVVLSGAAFVYAVAFPAIASYRLSDIVSEGDLAMRDIFWDEFMRLPYTGGLIDAGFIADGMYDQVLRARATAGDSLERRSLLVGEIENAVAYVEAKEAETAARHYRASYYAVKLLNLRNHLIPVRSREFQDRTERHLGDVFITGSTNPLSYFAAAEVWSQERDFEATGKYLLEGLKLAPKNPDGLTLVENYLMRVEDKALQAYFESLKEGEQVTE